MSHFTSDELKEAHRALLSTLHKCEKIDAAKMGKSQQTLLERRINALKVALKLIEKEQTQIERGMKTTMTNERVYKMTFASVYPLLVQKAERKGRTKDEVDTIIQWLTGYDNPGLQLQIDQNVTFETFFTEAPQMNPHTDKIKGVVCGVRVEAIEDPLMQKIRWLDKLVDELAKGKTMEKILRS